MPRPDTLTLQRIPRETLPEGPDPLSWRRLATFLARQAPTSRVWRLRVCYTPPWFGLDPAHWALGPAAAFDADPRTAPPATCAQGPTLSDALDAAASRFPVPAGRPGRHPALPAPAWPAVRARLAVFWAMAKAMLPLGADSWHGFVWLDVVVSPTAPPVWHLAGEWSLPGPRITASHPDTLLTLWDAALGDALADLLTGPDMAWQRTGRGLSSLSTPPDVLTWY